MRTAKTPTIETCEAREIFRLVHQDYRYQDDVFCPDDARMRIIKRTIAEILGEADRNLLILYAEVGSMVKVAKMMRVSKNTLRKNIDRIRDIIRNEFDS